jgi:hypothetical protein
MNYLTNLFGGGNAAGGMRKPEMGAGFDLYGGQPPSMNLGMSPSSIPTNAFADPTTGTGLKPPSSFGQMPAAGGGMNMQSALAAMQLLGVGGQQEQQAPVPQMQMPQLPMGSNQSYEDLMKMYGVRSGGLLG